MPYANTRAKPLTANESSEPSDEALKLESHLQKQLEEDVARIFDESIHTDLEVVCGKLKILTHTCILKARTNHFYAELKTVLHLNIGRDTFDEIYSFISDAYTECDVIDQEREIIEYLRNNLRTSNSNAPTSLKTKEESETLTLLSTEGKTKQKKINNSPSSKPTEDKVESDVFLTPKCVSPYGEKKLNNSIILSPSTELTKEYYALVPIERNLLEQELNEQDALSSAFQYIIKSQNSTPKISPLSKPTSLSLSSSHTPKTVKHSNSCDTINKSEDRTENLHANNITSLVTSQNPKSNCTTNLAISTDSFVKNSDNSVSGSEAVVDLTYSPDSLIVDDPSSSSDYLSAAYAGSPGVGPLGSFFQLNVEDNTSKMENIFTSSDSGLENTGLLESLNSHKDLTTADISLTESTLHELTGDEIHSHESTSSSDKHQLNRFKVRTSCSNTSPLSRTPSERSGNGQTHSPNKAKDITKSSKEEKQKQNEEIVIMESSSVSSETGSWESVFPPRLAEKDICEIFINTERQFACIDDVTVTQTVSYDDNVTITRTVSHPKITEQIYTNIVQSSPHKSTGCFIDASSLVDEEDDVVSTTVINELSTHIQPISLPAPSQPVPCSMVNKQDVSPNDWSECNENDDSLEQAENKDQDSIQRDLSPTIFEMTPITEDSLNTNPFEKQSNDIDASRTESNESASNVIYKDGGTHQYLSSSVVSTNTPFNSIMSLKTSSAKQYESEESMNDGVANNKENQSLLKKTKYNESPSIVSGDASVEDGLESSKPLNQNSRKSPKTSNAAAWVVDMSLSAKDCTSKKPADKACESLKYESNFDGSDSCIKSRGSVDSDGSEKSSHKFYIDLSSLPDPLPKNVDTGNVAEKKNMFSMYIDLGEKSTLKEMPSRLSSSLQTRKQSNSDVKTNVKVPRVTKAPLSECIIPTFPKIFDPNESPSTFETYESLCSNPNITVSEIISMSNDKSKTITREAEVGHRNTENEKRSKTNSVNGEKSSFSIVSNVIKEETSTDPCVDLFVKLSDLDKPLFKPDLTDFNNERKDGVDVRMTRSIPENNWGEQNHAVSSRSIEVISSFHSENALSLNRLFPHLKNEFSKSMPGSLSGKLRTSFRQDFPSSPGEMEEPVSDVSELSSVQSSSCRPGLENSTTETSQTSSLKGNFQSRLGQDLLRMFLQEIAPDVIVEVSGKRIKAHKCILSSRCQYFAGILSGGWVESAGNVIVMPPFSYNVVHFALCHIYSGVSTIPDSVSIVELATIADMLGLEGLKEAIMFHLKSKYCHHFHKPCPVCTAGVLECFPLLSVYGLDDLYRKCIRWITKYFQKVWPTKAFASLPRELVDKCYQEHIVNFTVESVIDTVYGCGMIAASLQPCKWSESIERLCRRLVNAGAHFAAPRLSGVLPAAAAVPADAPAPARHAVADCLTAAIQWAPPDETCRAYALLSSIVKEARAHLHCKPDLVHNGPVGKTSPQHNLLTLHANAWRMQCENALVSAAPRVVAAQAFEDLPPDLRKRLRELGCITVGVQASSHSYASKTQSSRARTSSTSKSLNIEHVRASFVPYKPKPLIAQLGGPPDKIKSSNELRDVKKVPKLNPPKIRTTKTQEERAKFNQMKTNKSVERVVKSKAPIRVNVFENTKPRYLEPRPCKDSLKQATKRLLSSSESSRSSPVLARSTRASRAKTKAQTMSRDSLATHSRPRTAEPSTDSLSESQTSNKFGTYTKPKQTSKGSVESVKSQKFQNILQSPIFNNKTKTKIPVHTSYSMKPNITDSKKNNDVHKRYIPTCKIDADMPTTSKNKTARKLPGSLMNATKSSSAKMVSKVAREPPVAKASTKQSKHHKQTNEQDELERPLDIPVMGRSGTFLKDEPTFGDKTTDINVSP